MADISHQPPGLAGHPDVSEMQARYARVLSGREAVAIDGLVLLTGLYLAISPWVVHFGATTPDMVVHNLILGIAISLLGLGLTMVPERMYGLSWAMAAMGVWLIISPWVVTRGPETGVIWNNVIVGGVTCLLGFTAAGMVMRTHRAAD